MELSISFEYKKALDFSRITESKVADATRSANKDLGVDLIKTRYVNLKSDLTISNPRCLAHSITYLISKAVAALMRC